MSWLYYLLEANIYLGVFYLGYYVLLKNEALYLLNRVYLLLSCLLSFLLPFIQISMLRPSETIVKQQVTVLPSLQHANVIPVAVATPITPFTLDDGLITLYILGTAVTLVLLFHRLYRLFSLIRKHKALPASRYKVIELSGEHTAFSLFNYLFIGSGLSQAETIVAHELVHIRQKHSADIIFLELIKVISWFNPLIYVIQRSLKTVHEYIADEQTAARNADCLAYSSFLLHNAYGLQGSALAHSFFNYNLLKKRIIMLNQKRSGRLARLKYLVAVPLCAGMICTSTLVFSKDYGLIDLAPARIAKLPVTREHHTAIGKALHETVKIDTPKIAPPPPPPAIKPNGLLAPKKTNRRPPPPPPAIEKAPPAVSQINRRPPPPPPYDSVYKDLIMYIAKHTRYPAVAHNNKINGNVFLSLNLNSKHQVSDVKIDKGIGYGCDEEAAHALKSYTGLINKAPGNYKLVVTYTLTNNDDTKFYGPKPLSEKIINTLNFIGEIIITGYVK